MTARAQRIMIWWSLSFMVIFGLSYYFLIGMWPLPPATWTPTEIADFYTENVFKIRLGAVILSWTSAFAVPIYVVIAVQMARLEKGVPIWTLLQLVGGAMMTIFLVLPPIFWGVAAYNPGRDPQVTAAIHEIANLILTTTDQYFIFQMVALAYVSLTQKVDPLSAFPRWYGYVTIWAAFMFELGAIAFLPKTGPFAWNGLFVFWFPIMIFGSWISLTAWLLFKAIKRQEAAS